MLCIVSSSIDTYSETFIHNHIKYLPNPKLVVYGSPTPHLILHSSLWTKISKTLSVIDKLIKKIFGKEHFLIAFFWVLFLKIKKVKYLLCEYGNTGEAFLMAVKINKINLIVNFHGYDAYCSSVVKENTNLYSKLFYLSKKIVVVSEHMKTQLNRLGCPFYKIVIVKYGAIDSFFNVSKKQKKEELYFLSVGRFVNKKAPYLTILAFNEILKEFPNIKLKMVGYGVLFDMCVQLTKSLGIESKIEFLGVKNSLEIAELMSESIGFVQHSITALDGDSEGTPVAILEAMAVGLPIVSTYHTGITEVIEHGKTGFLVNEKDYKGMANYMKFIVENPNISNEIGTNAQKYALDNFNLEKQIKKLYDVIINNHIYNEN